MTEEQQAVILANKVLDNAHLDPDGDLSILARQFLRKKELADILSEAIYNAGIKAGYIQGCQHVERDILRANQEQDSEREGIEHE